MENLSNATTKATTIADSSEGLPIRISYEEEFEELKCIGRGNFGAAFLVKMR